MVDPLCFFEPYPFFAFLFLVGGGLIGLLAHQVGSVILAVLAIGTGGMGITCIAIALDFVVLKPAIKPGKKQE